MTTITRRAALGALASIPATAGATAAFASSAISQPETPDERAVRLARELSEAMNGFMNPRGETPHWVAHVKPSSYPGPISFSQDAAPVSTSDPLLDLIKQYRDGLAAYNALPEKDDLAAEANSHLWQQPFDALSEWEGPARTRKGALAALRLASYENGNGDSPLTIPLINAALAYFEARS